MKKERRNISAKNRNKEKKREEEELEWFRRIDANLPERRFWMMERRNSIEFQKQRGSRPFISLMTTGRCGLMRTWPVTAPGCSLSARQYSTRDDRDALASGWNIALGFASTEISTAKECSLKIDIARAASCVTSLYFVSFPLCFKTDLQRGAGSAIFHRFFSLRVLLTISLKNQNERDLPLAGERTEVWITNFDEIWHKCSLWNNIWSVFIGNLQCWRGENNSQSWGCETYFAKYLGNDQRYSICKLMKLTSF